MISQERWLKFSRVEQMGNIASEMTRAVSSKKRGEDASFIASLDRVNEMITLTLDDEHWGGRRKELARMGEIVNDWYGGGAEYAVPLEWLARYATQFMYLK